MYDDNRKQNKLPGFVYNFQAPTAEEFLQNLINLHGQKVVADLLGCDISKISRAKNGEKGFTVKEWQRLLDLGNAVIMSAQDYDDLMTWGCVSNKMHLRLREEMKAKGNGG